MRALGSARIRISAHEDQRALRKDSAISAQFNQSPTPSANTSSLNPTNYIPRVQHVYALSIHLSSLRPDPRQQSNDSMNTHTQTQTQTIYVLHVLNFDAMHYSHPHRKHNHTHTCSQTHTHTHTHTHIHTHTHVFKHTHLHVSCVRPDLGQ